MSFVRRTPRALAAVVAITLSASGCDRLGIGSSVQGDESEAPAVADRVARPAGPLAAFIDEIPDAEARELDLEMALTLVAMPLSCVDRPHAAPRDRSTYLDEIVAVRRPGYERNRAFYGCWDWHSAVNSTWAMVRIYKEFPDLPVGGLVTEKLTAHLSAAAIEGEVAFFEENRTFERPYGYGWLLALYAELRTWDRPEAQRWADNLEPLVTMFSERTVLWLAGLDRPSRNGTHSNTAFSLAMMLSYARLMEDTALQEAIEHNAVRLFREDVRCPTGYEPWGADFLSPCLEEAALMAAVLEPDEFLPWFDAFMPDVASADFEPLTRPVDTAGGGDEPEADGADAVVGATDAAVGADPGAGSTANPAARGARRGTTGAGADDATGGDETAGEGASDDEQSTDPPTAGDADERRRADAALRSLASRSHLIGLAFIRADAMNRIVAALPANDPRVEVYRKLALLHGSMGFEAMFDADYAGSHWIGTFALKYLLSER